MTCIISMTFVISESEYELTSLIRLARAPNGFSNYQKFVKCMYRRVELRKQVDIRSHKCLISKNRYATRHLNHFFYYFFHLSGD